MSLSTPSTTRAATNIHTTSHWFALVVRNLIKLGLRFALVVRGRKRLGIRFPLVVRGHQNCHFTPFVVSDWGKLEIGFPSVFEVAGAWACL